MQSTFVKVSSKGQLVIPSAIRDALAIKPGTKIAMTVEGSRIVLQPANLRLIEEMYGITAGGPSMTDALLAERRVAHARSEEKHQEWLNSGAMK